MSDDEDMIAKWAQEALEAHIEAHREQPPDDDPETEHWRETAAVLGRLLTAHTDTEINASLRATLELTTDTAFSVIACLTGMVADLLDEYWDEEDPQRLEWIAARVDIIATHEAT